MSEKVLKNLKKNDLIAIRVLHLGVFGNNIFLVSGWFKDTRNSLSHTVLKLRVKQVT